jgi:hypothetical protein
MIQRYNIYNHPIARISYQVAADDNGEWVKWEDIKHLMPFQEELEKEIEIILNGNPNAPKPKGIISGGFK